MTLSNVIIITLLLSFAYMWWRSMGVRHKALFLAKQYLAEADLELLDESLVVKKLRLRRNATGMMSILRRYEFEFTSTGTERYVGYIEMLGFTQVNIELDAYRING